MEEKYNYRLPSLHSGSEAALSRLHRLVLIILTASLLFPVFFMFFAFSACFGQSPKHAEKAKNMKNIGHAFGMRMHERGERPTVMGIKYSSWKRCSSLLAI